MHVLRFLHNRSAEQLGLIHKRRFKTVWVAVTALLRGQQLWLTAIGRSVDCETSEKHAIKRIDRLLGNANMHSELVSWYRWIARTVIAQCRHPIILVDWSDIDDRGRLHVLRAAVAVGGRALPIYELVHDRLHDPQAHKRFLKRLSSILDSHCKPILVTDAGFRCDWYLEVEKMNWYYVGRVRNNELVRWPRGGVWFSNKVLLKRATRRARSLGALWIRRLGPCLLDFYTYRSKRKGRVKLTRAGARMRRAHSKKHERREREPWLLVSNLEHTRSVAKRVIAIYKTRMQVEEGFRDLKSLRHGFALRHNLGRNLQRIANLLLLAALGVLATWLVGLHGYAHQLHRALQANTVRSHRVLSTFFVGRRLLAKQLALTRADMEQALRRLRQDVETQVIV